VAFGMRLQGIRLSKRLEGKANLQELKACDWVLITNIDQDYVESPS
jgi:hypothetical protein